MRKSEFITVAAALLILIEGATAAYSGEKNSGWKFRFLPAARISLAPAFVQNEKSYMSFSRYLSADALRFGPIACSFSTYEILNYGEESGPMKLDSIYYNMEYINLRVDTPQGSGSLFIDHRCMNYSDNPAPPPLIRWYGYGLRWESRGMMIGEKDSKHGLNLFSSGDYINFSASARKPINTRFYPYDFTADFMLRFDYYLTPTVIPYISGSAEMFHSLRTEWNRSAECGVRLAYSGADIIPFAGYSYITDIDIADSEKKWNISAGLRVESSLSAEGNSNPGVNSGSGMISLSPELHLQGSYCKYIDDKNRNFRSDILFSFTLLTAKGSGLFFNTSLAHSSPQLGNDTGLYPRYIDYYHEAGLSFNSWYGIFIEPLYRYTGYGEGNTVTAGGYSYHLAGLRIRTCGMRPGFINSSVSGKFTEGVRILLNTEAEIFTGWIPESATEKNCWIIEGTLREDILSFWSAVPYLSINAAAGKPIIKGKRKIEGEITPECGIRFNRDLVLILFYQYIRKSSDNPEYDIKREYHLAGVRIDI